MSHAESRITIVCDFIFFHYISSQKVHVYYLFFVWSLSSLGSVRIAKKTKFVLIGDADVGKMTLLSAFEYCCNNDNDKVAFSKL